MSYYKKLVEGFSYHDTVIDGTKKYYLYLNKDGVVLILREETATDEMRYCVKTGAYVTIKTGVTGYDYLLRSQIKI